MQRTLKHLAILALCILALCILAAPSHARAQPFKSPDILVLGDSQITFGAGPAYVDFFSNPQRSCRATGANRKNLKKLAKKCGRCNRRAVDLSARSVSKNIPRKIRYL